MIRKRTFQNKKKADVYHEQRFFPAGNYTWTVPNGCTSVDVFLVGGGGGAGNIASGGSGYTKCFKSASSGYRTGDAVPVTPGQSIPVVVGSGGDSYTGEDIEGNPGTYSQFKSSTYRAGGGGAGRYYYTGSYNGYAGDGGSGGAGWPGNPGSDGSDGYGGSRIPDGSGQGYTTRDFGDSSGKRNAGGGGCNRGATNQGGASDYTQGKGGDASGDDPNHPHSSYGGGGYGGGAAGISYATRMNPGGDGTVLIRYYSYD